MESVGQGPTTTETDPRLVDVLTRLNEIGTAINHIGAAITHIGAAITHSGAAITHSGVAAAEAGPSGEAGGVCTAPALSAGMAATLQLIVDSAVQVVPGAAAVIYIYDPAARGFDPASRVSAGERTTSARADAPRPDGLGTRAINQRRLVLSYEEPELRIHPLKAQEGATGAACFPLVVAEQVVGALYVYLYQDRPFGQLELLMMENLRHQAAMAIYQMRRLTHVQRDLARKEDELSRLRRAGLLISSRLGLEETLEAILQMALEVTGAIYGIFRLVDKSGREMITRAIAGERLDRPLVEALSIDEHSVMGWVATHRESVCIHDLRAEPWNRIYYPLDAELEMRSELAVPLISASGRLEGVLNLESPLVGAFGEQDRHLLQSLATQAVIAIQEVRLLDALQEVAQRLLNQPCQEVLSHLVDVACDLLNAAASAIWTLEDDRLTLEVSSAGYQRGESLPLHGSLAGQAILSKGAVTADDVRADPRFHRPDLASAQNWTRALVVPLLASDDREPVGAFSVYSTGGEPGRFAESEWDEKVLSCLAHYAALAVHNAAHQEALRAAQEQYAVAETFAAVGDIAANVLHHLNNKVGTIPVRVQGIQDKCRSAVLADVYLATNLGEIERSAAEAMQAVRENLSHLNPIHLAPVNVAACVSDALRAASLPGGVQVQVEGFADLPPVVAGQRGLTLVFANLLENAAEAMQGQGTVTIRGTSHDHWVQVAVVDDGPGIAPELHDRIFEFSYSGRSASRPDRLGFGLWWVKTLMVRLGGSVWVESDGEQGTAFHLKLPRAGGTL